MHPVLARVWREILSCGTPQTPGIAAVLDAEAGGYLPGGTCLESSRNWSGARAVPVGGQRFRFVAGGWQAPRLAPAAAPDAAGLDHRCSVWIGFGGHRLWSRALPQLGTLHIAGAPDRHLPFVQWWIRGNPRSGALILDRPRIGPGERVLCFLWLRSPWQAAIWLANANARTPPVAACLRSPDDGVPAAGASAQWIVERPRDPRTKALHPLADFGTVVFGDAAAGATGVPERPAGADRLHRMIAATGLPRRSRCIAAPRRRTGPRGPLVEVTFR
nr:G1 family glutamic endopeptidase [Caldovatus aquaticus]